MDIIQESFGKLSGGKILDVGTGRGWFVRLLKENLKNYDEIIGIDIRENVLEIAREKFGAENIKFGNMDATKLEFADNSIDTVSISNTLHHLPVDLLEKILIEMKRVLKPKGHFIIQEMFCDNQSEKQQSHVLLHHLQGEMDTLLGICHRETYKRHEIIDVAKGLGLEVIDEFEYNTHEDHKEVGDLQKEKETLDNIFEALEVNVLHKLKGHEKYDYYKNRINELKETLYDIGFFTATELVVIAKK